ncbi:MAG: hypothetical protein CMJ36_02920 [Phycisphaerae bacterium]|nr:hypothetical protein [Phycisphaerae bacterium]
MIEHSNSDRLLTADELAEMFGVETEDICYWAKEGMHDFPPALKLAGNTLRWRESDIDRWINERTESD